MRHFFEKVYFSYRQTSLHGMVRTLAPLVALTLLASCGLSRDQETDGQEKIGTDILRHYYTYPSSSQYPSSSTSTLSSSTSTGTQPPSQGTLSQTQSPLYDCKCPISKDWPFLTFNKAEDSGSGPCEARYKEQVEGEVGWGFCSSILGTSEIRPKEGEPVGCRLVRTYSSLANKEHSHTCMESSGFIQACGQTSEFFPPDGICRSIQVEPHELGSGQMVTVGCRQDTIPYDPRKDSSYYSNFCELNSVQKQMKTVITEQCQPRPIETDNQPKPKVVLMSNCGDWKAGTNHPDECNLFGCQLAALCPDEEGEFWMGPDNPPQPLGPVQSCSCAITGTSLTSP